MRLRYLFDFPHGVDQSDTEARHDLQQGLVLNLRHAQVERRRRCCF